MRAFSPACDGALSSAAKTGTMAVDPSALPARADHAPATVPGKRGERAERLLTGGGTDGNEQLTAMVGVLLLVLLAVIGVTILRKSQLIWVHLFVGLLLMGPVALKMASTRYRFVRYYTGARAYRRKGPPLLPLRLIAPAVVITTVLVFASGFVLLFDGPAHRGPWASIHKVSFIVWLAFTALHVLGHLQEMPASLRAARPPSGASDELAAGSAGRWVALVGVCVLGLVLAVLLIPQFSAWTGPGAFPHHHHH
jgi:hypothetical protein